MVNEIKFDPKLLVWISKSFYECKVSKSLIDRNIEKYVLWVNSTLENKYNDLKIFFDIIRWDKWAEFFNIKYILEENNLLSWDKLKEKKIIMRYINNNIDFIKKYKILFDNKWNNFKWVPAPLNFYMKNTDWAIYVYMFFYKNKKIIYSIWTNSVWESLVNQNYLEWITNEYKKTINIELNLNEICHYSLYDEKTRK